MQGKPKDFVYNSIAFYFTMQVKYMAVGEWFVIVRLVRKKKKKKDRVTETQTERGWDITSFVALKIFNIKRWKVKEKQFSIILLAKLAVGAQVND